MLNKNYLFSLLNVQASAKSRAKSRQCKRTFSEWHLKGAMTYTTMTFSIMTLSIKLKSTTLGINTTLLAPCIILDTECRYAECHYAEWWGSSGKKSLYDGSLLVVLTMKLIKRHQGSFRDFFFSDFGHFQSAKWHVSSSHLNLFGGRQQFGEWAFLSKFSE